MLTTAIKQDYALHVATMRHRLSILDNERHSRYLSGFFVRKISVQHHYVGLCVAPARVAGARTGMLTMHSPAPLISILLPGLKPLRDTIMNALTQLTISDISIRQDEHGRYCLNDLHKAAGNEKRHQPSNWLQIDQTKELIQEASTPGITGIKTDVGRYGGTFAIKELVYSYAMWISPKFHLAVIRAYDALVTGQIQYGTNQLPEPKTKKALPGGLTLEQQDTIKALVKERAQSLPKNKQAGATVRIWSAIKKKFGASYKAVSPDNFVSIISLISRMPLEGELVEHDDRLLSDNEYRAKARSIAISYINACRESVKAAAGIQPKWPEIPQELADGILADMLMSQRFMLSFDNDMKLKMSQIPKNAYVIDPDNKPSMAELMLEHINGDLLPELMQIALTRLANAAKQN